MKHEFPQPFARNYESLLKRLKLRGMQPKTIESYSHGVCRAAAHFGYRIDDLNKDQLADYFAGILEQLSWSTLKCDLYGLKFYYAYVLDKPWPGAELTKAPKVSRLPDIVTVAQMQQIVDATRVLSYRVFFFALYSMGLRLGEGLQLRVAAMTRRCEASGAGMAASHPLPQAAGCASNVSRDVGDLDAERMRVHVRDAKGNRDRLVPLPANALEVLREFWKVHRNPVLLFPSRKKGLGGAASATTHMDRGGVQQALRQVTEQIGLKKELRRIA